MTQLLRPLTLGELLDRTFSLYRRHAVVFVGLVALPNLLGLGANIMKTALFDRPSPQASQLLISGLITIVLALFSMVTMAISQAATMVAVSRLHLEQPVTISDAFAGLRGRIARLCGITVVLGLMTFGAFMLLILPGLFVLVRWSLAIPAAVLEGAGLRRAMGRSAALVEGQYGRIFMIYVLYALMILTFTIALTVPGAIVAVVRGGEFTDMAVWVQIASEVGAFFVQCLIGPLLTIAIALWYYDSRVRKEAFDLEHMLAQLGPAETQPVTTA